MEINEGTSKSNDDIIQAFEVFNNVFGNISNEQFVNKHYNNPERLNKAIYYMKENGKMIGINGFMGCVLHNKILLLELHKVVTRLYWMNIEEREFLQRLYLLQRMD